MPDNAVFQTFSVCFIPLVNFQRSEVINFAFFCQFFDYFSGRTLHSGVPTALLKVSLSVVLLNIFLLTIGTKLVINHGMEKR